ncbi:MAG: hypothetical protein AAGA54_11545 [Myxococcota bacterium]
MSVRAVGFLSMSLALGACLPDNPSGSTETDASDGADATTAVDSADNMLGCDPGETCWVVLTAQTLDDRVEIFGGAAGNAPSYRGALDLDLKPGTELGPLDEPFGMSLSDTGLHVITGHYPTRELGAMLTFPTALFDEQSGTIDVDTFFTSGVFSEGVVETRFDEIEPIFALPQTVSGKVLVSVFANDLFAAEDTWIEPGKLAVVDAANPADFALATLSGLDGGDCLGASQVVLLENEQSAAVACDGNEAVAFLDLGDLSASPGDVAGGITGRICDLPFQNDRRARYLAHDGAGGVLLGLGPTPLNATTSQIYSVTSDCNLSPIDVADSDGQLGEIVRFDDTHWLLAQGAIAPQGVRGVQVVSPTGICNTLTGLEDAWSTEGDTISPYAIAVAPDGEHLAVGAGPSSIGNVQNSIYGKLLWVTLEGADDPCTMTAEFVDLTDGGGGRAPAPSVGDEATWRRGPNVVVIAEVTG